MVVTKALLAASNILQPLGFGGLRANVTNNRPRPLERLERLSVIAKFCVNGAETSQPRPFAWLVSCLLGDGNRLFVIRRCLRQVSKHEVNISQFPQQSSFMITHTEGSRQREGLLVIGQGLGILTYLRTCIW